MKKYDNYKDSGIEWIGSYPKDWTLMTVRRITDDHKQGYYSSEEYKEEGYRLVRITDLDINGNINISKSPYVSPNDKEIQIFEIKKGDMLFPRTGSIGLIGVAKEDMKAVFASYLIRFRFNVKTHNSFMRYYFMSDIFLNGLFSDLHGGVNQNIHAENIKDQHIVLPSKNEQIYIANYLDHKTSQIDTLIAKKEQFITFLQEERTAVINQAVTKGLDPKVKMKDSGIEWLGEIPEHWEVILFKRIIARIKDGTHGTFQRLTEGYPFLSAKNVYNDGLKISETESLISKNDYLEITKNGFPKRNDLLITCVGTIGRTFVYDLDEPIAFQRSVTFIRFNENINPQFYKFYVQSSIYQNLLISLAKTSAQSGIYMNDLMNTYTLRIPFSEQTKIVEFLKTITLEIDEIILKAQQEIELLKEYKTALISEVVTGKVDVREEILN